jgi:hypothetical protein
MKHRFLAALLLVLLGLCLPVTGTVWLCGAGEQGLASGCGSAEVPADCCGGSRSDSDEGTAHAGIRSTCGLCFVLPAMEKAHGGVSSPTTAPAPMVREGPARLSPPAVGRAETPVDVPDLVANPARKRSLLAVWRV